MQDEIKEVTLTRTGQPPLRFKGVLLGVGSTRGQSSTRWTEVSIHRTSGGKFVACVARRTQWENEHDHVDAKASSTAAEVIGWLGGSEGTLGPASQKAVEQAAQSDPAFAAAWQERVD